jgi:heme/copper-type cytochrome/quinol oxidase subunit 2
MSSGNSQAEVNKAIENISDPHQQKIYAAINSGINETNKNIKELKDALEWKREITRSILSCVLVLGVLGTILGTFIYIFRSTARESDKEQVQATSSNKELITVMWTSQITLLGSALGFYFGSKSDAKKQ